MPKRSLSLPTRLALAVTAALVVTTVAADLMAVRGMRLSLASAVSDSLAAMIGRMARQIDLDIANLRELLAGEARAAGALPIPRAADILERKGSVLNFAFDYGVLLVDAAGRVAGDTRGRDWDGVDLSEYEFFQRTFALGRPVLSEPFAAPDAGHPPVVMFTAPIRDADGRMRGMLAGGLDLVGNRILAAPTGHRVSRYGQIGIFTRDGLVVAHSERRFILDAFENPMPPSGAGEAPGVREIALPDGGNALLAVSALDNADWILAGTFPILDVQAPIERGFAAAHRWFAVGLLVCCALVWLISWRIARHLDALTGEIEALDPLDASAPGRRVRDAYPGEAGRIGGAVNAMLSSLEQARDDIDGLSARLAETEERERRAIAQDLHDSVCQTLALAAMRLGAARRELGGGLVAERLDGTRELLERAVGELRSLTFDLSPSILYEFGLAAALEWQAGQFAGRYGMAADFSGPASYAEPSRELAMFLYRAAGELLANAAKHSGAKAVHVSLFDKGDELILEVRDDGVGLPAGGAPASGFGLRNLRERARRFRGSVDLEKPPGGGLAARVRARRPG